MLYVNDLSDTVRTFLAERSGTPTSELIGVCQYEAEVQASSAAKAVLFADALDGELIDQAHDQLAAAKEFLSVAERLEAEGELF